MTARVFIGLGSNLGDRAENLARARRAIGALEGTELLGESSCEETDPVDFLAQPRFLNQVVCIGTPLSPPELLDALLGIERSMGRTRGAPKGPRIIDLDILLFGDIILRTDTLTIPHPRIWERDFVVRHLVQLDRDLRDPVSARYFREGTHGTDTHHQ
ncbi:MAG: 2-amino-4-hydroxy-6-hydroxymethyldihydropteridine diphosphokinase [Spirochaetes bacterium]|nr:MAG: 2-amino-4-hydroxy-6-hydroxymethyldihydropteridine diphosphokinase [Spirochaetota bacterium]